MSTVGRPPVNPPPCPSQPPPWPAARDHTPPGLLLLAPYRGAHVGAQQQVTVRLNDETGVSLLVYFVDGRMAAVHNGQRMTQDSWQWSGLQPGWHLLQARALDAARNWRQVSVWVRH